MNFSILLWLLFFCVISGHRNHIEVFWHSSCCSQYVCAEVWVSLYCIRVWKPVSVNVTVENILFYLNGVSLIMLFSVSSSYLYQIAQLGDDDEEPRFSSASQLEEGEPHFFSPRPLKNLVQVDEMDSLSPITHCQVCS